MNRDKGRLFGWKVYKKRNAELALMGFKSYAEYLGSELWKAIHARVLTRHVRCAFCPDASVQIHHLSYLPPVLRGEDDSPLIAVCRGCHYSIEVDESGRKRSPFEVGQLIFSRRVEWINELLAKLYPRRFGAGRERRRFISRCKKRRKRKRE